MLEKILTPENLGYMFKAAGMSIVIAICAVIAGTIIGIIGAVISVLILIALV